jgi:hypothetical protein
MAPGSEWSQKPATASPAAPISASFSRRDEGHVVAVGELATDAGKEEERCDEHGTGQCDERLRVGSGHLVED